MITPDEKNAFENNGYHVLRGALTAAEVENYRDALQKLYRIPETHPYASRLRSCPVTDVRPTPDNPRALWNGFDLPLFDDRLYDLIFHPNIALTMDALIGPDINFFETCFVTKLPYMPATFRDWHQDSVYYDPQTNDRNCAVALYLDEMDTESGATGVVPGSHRRGPIPHISPTESLTSSDLEVVNKRDYDTAGVFHHFQPGDALFFLARTVHKAGGNNTDTSRTALIYNFVRKDTLDLGERNHSVANSIPVTRSGRIYTPNQK